MNANDVVNVTGGTLNSNNATALGTLAVVNVAAGATLSLGASQTLAALGDAGPVVVNAASVQLNGNVLTVGSGNNLSSTFSGVIADGTGGVGSLIKVGMGILTLDGSNTYSGSTTLSGGTLAVANASSLGASSGSLVIGPATLEVAGNFADGRNIYLTDPSATIQVDPSFTYSNSGTLSGTGGLSLTGPGTLILCGSNSYTGGTFVDAGTLEITEAGALLSGSRLTVGASASLLFGASLQAASAVDDVQTVPESGTLVLLGVALCTAAAYQRAHSRRNKQ